MDAPKSQPEGDYMVLNVDIHTWSFREVFRCYNYPKFIIGIADTCT